MRLATFQVSNANAGNGAWRGGAEELLGDFGTNWFGCLSMPAPATIEMIAEPVAFAGKPPVVCWRAWRATR